MTTDMASQFLKNIASHIKWAEAHYVIAPYQSIPMYVLSPQSLEGIIGK